MYMKKKECFVEISNGEVSLRWGEKNAKMMVYEREKQEVMLQCLKGY